jgi:hypothetical protein
MATRTASLSSTIRLMESSSPSATPTTPKRRPTLFDRWALRLARALLRWRVSKQWGELEQHIDNCPRRACKWWKQNGVPEDQQADMFCHEGAKLWSRNFDMSYAAETLD